MPGAARWWPIARCCAAVASCPVLRGGGFLPGAARRCRGGFLPGAARRWLLARCGAAVASCPVLRGRRWLLARCGEAVASCHLSSNVLRADRECWRLLKLRKYRARCGESRTNVGKCSELALIAEELRRKSRLLQWGNVEERMRDGWERKVRSSSFFYQNMASRAREKNLFFPLRPSSPAAGTSPLLTSKVLLFILRPLGSIDPGGRALGPRVRPRRHATQRTRSGIFKLSVTSP